MGEISGMSEAGRDREQKRRNDRQVRLAWFDIMRTIRHKDDEATH